LSDILTDKGGDLVIENGDLVTGDSEVQEIESILVAEKGHFSQFPLIGVGVRKRLSGPFKAASFKRDVRVNLESDGFNVNKVDVDEEGNVQVDAKR